MVFRTRNTLHLRDVEDFDFFHRLVLYPEMDKKPDFLAIFGNLAILGWFTHVAHVCGYFESTCPLLLWSARIRSKS